MVEEWRDIIIEKNGEVYDYVGFYQVSNYGRIRNSRTGKILKPIKSKGYQYIRLNKNGFLIHRLVATMFIPNPYNYPIVNHKDENPSNNYIDNLEWVTAKYNVNYGTRNERAGVKISEKIKGKPKTEEHKRKISEAKTGDNNPMAKKVICLETKQVFNCIKDASEWCGKKGISGCCRGQQKTAGGYHWMYYEDYLTQQENVESFN